MPHIFHTLAAPAQAEVEIKRSRFLALVTPVVDEDQARATIEQVRREHPQARHHCTAFVLGPGQEIQRSNDDGEPSGTAGAPILETLLAHELSNVVAVITRYFGGVLLGAGGLVRAYRSATAAGIDAGTIRTHQKRQEYSLTLDHALAPLLEAQARREKWPMRATYRSQVELTLAITPEQTNDFFSFVADLTRGQATPTPGEIIWA